MVTKDEARQLVVNHLSGPDWQLPDDVWIVLDEATIEKSWGWVFFYTSRLWHETGDFKYAVAGNAPLLVERGSGRILPTGTAHSIEYYIDNYEHHGTPES